MVPQLCLLVIPVISKFQSQTFNLKKKLKQFLGIPLTIQSNRPSSRSSQRSTGSLDSYNGRRSSGCKGILVSQSRQGSARSAAILLISAHLNTLKEQSSSSSPNNFRSNEFMTKHIERQLEIQKKILYSEIPALRNHSSLMRKLRLNPKSDTDLTRLDNDAGLHHIIGENPLHKKLHRKFFNKSTAITTSSNSKYAASPEEQERSGVEDVFVDRNIETNLNGSSESRINNISLRTDGGYTNPLAFSADFLNGSSSTISSCSASYSNSEDEEFQRRYNADYQENFIGTMPTPASENPSIAVNNNNESMSILFFY